jgi:hypothetical protein
MILPLLLVIGGMTIWSTTDIEVEIKFENSRASTGTRGWRGSQNLR